MMVCRKRVWIGLAHIVPRKGTLPFPSADTIGAYTNVLAWAENEGDFVRKATQWLRRLDFKVVGIEDIEPYSMRPAAGRIISKKVRGLERLVRKDHRTRVDTIYTYSNDE